MCGGSNLKAKRKRLSIVFATLYAAKQGADRAERAQAKGCDYATGAHVTEETDSRGRLSLQYQQKNKIFFAPFSLNSCKTSQTVL